MSDCFPPHGLQHAGLPYPSLSPGVCSNSCPLQSVKLANHLILCQPLLFPSTFTFHLDFPNINILHLLCFFLVVGDWVALSCPALCDPLDHSPPGSSVHGILQAKILERVAIPFSIHNREQQKSVSSELSCAPTKHFKYLNPSNSLYL